MSPDQAAELVLAGSVVHREDIARAKAFLVQADGGRTDALADQWLASQNVIWPRSVDTDAAGAADVLASAGRAYALRLAFYQAIWELLTACEMVPSESFSSWKASLEYTSQRYRGAVRLNQLRCSFPLSVERPPFRSATPTDPDLFLQGMDSKSLHPGIREAIDQALACFRRGLYLPATAMLAAAAEAAWTECGAAVGTKLGDGKLQATIADPLASISKKVVQVRKSLETPSGKMLLKGAGQAATKIVDAELWTTTLRDRRNALHWGKARSFVASHSDTGTLLMAAPLHVGTLEAVRLAC